VVQQSVSLWIVILLVAVAAVGGVAAWILSRPATDSLRELQSRLPDQALGWRAEGAADRYDAETIYSYINGHAEVYLAYGMSGSLARRYKGPGNEPDLVLDLFELASPADAYGVFTHDLEGEPAGVGNDSLLRYGWLSFWQDRYFVSIVAEEETEQALQAVVELAQRVADRLPPGGEAPAIVSLLPAQGRLPRSVRFLRHHQILNTHRFVGTENLLLLDAEVEAALAGYRRGEEKAHLLLVDYPEPGRAEAAAEAFSDTYIPQAEDDASRESGEEGWYGVRRDEGRLAVVLGATTEELGSALLAEAMKTSSGGPE